MHKLFSILLSLIALFLISCKKEVTNGSGDNNGGGTPPPVAKDTVPTDPAIAPFTGFFMDRWSSKNFSRPGVFKDTIISGQTPTATVTINTGEVIAKIPANYFGNNSNTWIGQLGTQTTLINHLNELKPRIIRGPAGSVSDIFFFNAPNNTPPADAPAQLLNSSGVAANAGYWYGKNTDSWTQSMDSYYSLLQQTNSTGLLTVNYGYARYGLSANPVAAAAHLAADWVRYDNGRTKYWEVGNESFGDWEAGYRINTATNKDGQPQIITGQLYGKHFKVFADSMRKAAQEKGLDIKIGAVLYDKPAASWDSDAIKNWNAGVLGEAAAAADYFIVHNYFTNYYENSSAETIFNTAVSAPAIMKTYLTQSITAAGVATKPVALTEWNLFSSGSKQNVSNIAGMHAVLTIAELIKHGFGISLRWDLANGWDNGDDHGLFSMGDEPGTVSKWTPRPAFYYLYYLQQYSGDRMLGSSVSGNNNIVSMASSFSSGEKAVVLTNKSTGSITTEVKFSYFTPGNNFYYYVLTGGTDNGEFSRMVYVNGTGPENKTAGGPVNTYTTIPMYRAAAGKGIKITLPPRSTIYLVVDKK